VAAAAKDSAVTLVVTLVIVVVVSAKHEWGVSSTAERPNAQPLLMVSESRSNVTEAF